MEGFVGGCVLRQRGEARRSTATCSLGRSALTFGRTASTLDPRIVWRGRTLRDSVEQQLCSEDETAGADARADNKVSKAMVPILCAVRAVQRRITRIPNVRCIPPWMYKHGKTLRGRVVAVPDGDNFVMIHEPKLLLLNRNEVDPVEFDTLSFRNKFDNSIRVRLAGVDAPEGAFDGGPGQPFYAESKQYLQDLILNKHVTIELVGRDKYSRVIAIVHSGWGPFRRIVNAQMLEKGLASIYWGINRRFGTHYHFFRQMERQAKIGQRMIWSDPEMVKPGEYKKSLASHRSPARGKSCSKRAQKPKSGASVGHGSVKTGNDVLA